MAKEMHCEANLDRLVLEAIEKTPHVNQRVLSRRTSRALGMINSCIKRLVRKGLVKMSEAPGRRYLYYLTPQGIQEKVRLTYDYVQYSVQFYAESRGRCRVLFADMVEGNVRRVGFLGKSELAEIAYLTLQEFPIEFLGLSDDDEAGTNFFGHTVRSVEAMRKQAGQANTVVIYTYMRPPTDVPSVAGVEFKEIVP